MAEALKILIVTDKFKGSLTASEAAQSIRKGLVHGFFVYGKTHKIKTLPMADGGEGTIDVIKKSNRGKLIYKEVYDPLLRPVKAAYLVKGSMTFIEMAKCCGLQLLKESEYDLRKTSTYGLGQMILAGIKNLTTGGGVEAGEINASGEKAGDIIIGIGGSATNDGGMGMLRALGYRFYDQKGKETVYPGYVKDIDGTNINTGLKNVHFKVACDVNNPLLGERGATKVYGPQKGADCKMVDELEHGMQNYAKVCEAFLGKSYSEYPGAGAAGGVGFALMGFLKAEMIPGWMMLSELTELEEIVKESDLVITGEGRVDEQSISGKLINGIASITQKYKKRLWVFCGLNDLNCEQLKQTGIERIFAISDIEDNTEVSTKDAKKLLEKISYKSATFLDPFESNIRTD